MTQTGTGGTAREAGSNGNAAHQASGQTSGFLRRHRRALALSLLAAAIGLAVLLAPWSANVPPRAIRALAITAATVVLWATVAIPQPAASVVFIALVIASGVATPATALSGFASNAIWLVLGGMLIGLAAERSGFGRYIARRSVRSFRGSYSNLILGVIAGTTVLTFLIPATMGRIAITVPVVLALAKEAGYEPDSNGYVGLVVAAVIGNFTIALGVLSGNLLNMMVLGSGETLYGTNITYLRYLMLCGPVIGLVKGLITWRTIVWVYGAPPPRFASAPAAPEQLAPAAVRIGAILACTIALWASDVLHGLKPGTVAIFAGLACAIPGVGVLNVRDVLEPHRLIMMIWVATVFSLGAVLGEAGASQLVSVTLAGLAQIEGRSPLYAYFAVALIASALTMVMTIGGAIPIAATAVGGFNAATGLPIETGVLAVLAGMSALFLPFAAAPVMVGLAMGKVDQLVAARFTVVSSLLTWLIVLPLNALWWRLLGFLP